MMRFLLLLLLAIGCATGAEAPARGSDRIIGKWRVPEGVARKPATIEFRPDGVCTQEILGSQLKGTWKRKPGGRYGITPGGENDYLIIRGGKLLLCDPEGCFRTYVREK